MRFLCKEVFVKLKLHQDVYTSVILFMVAFFFLVRSLLFPFEAAIYPLVLMGLILFLDIFVLIGGIRKTRQRQAGDDSVQTITWAMVKMPVIVLCFVVAYIVLFHWANYFIATPVFLILLMLYFKVRSWKAFVFVPLCYLAFTYLLFVWQLKVPLF
jgi:hypothetical protein